MEKSKKKGVKINLIICAAAFIIMLVYLFAVDKPENIIGALKTINPLFLIIAALFMGGYWLCESAVIHSLLKGIVPKVKFRYCWTNTVIGQYFNCITPFASGGQPMQAYYFTQFGIPLGAGLTALLSRFIVYQFVLTLYSAFTLAVGFGQFGNDLTEKGLMPFVLIGFAVNLVVMVFLVGIAVWTKGTLKFTNAVITLLTKMRIIKDPISKRLYFTREIHKFHKNFMFLKNNVRIIIKSCFFTFLQFTLQLSISYILYLGFGLETSGYLQIISYQAYVQMISAFIPSPGAMGAAELGFAGFFKNIFGSLTGVTMMLWRIITFYLPIIVGMIHMLLLKKIGYAEPSKSDLENISERDA